MGAHSDLAVCKTTPHPEMQATGRAQTEIADQQDTGKDAEMEITPEEQLAKQLEANQNRGRKH